MVLYVGEEEVHSLASVMARELAEAIARGGRVGGRMYGIWLACHTGELSAYVWPLYELTLVRLGLQGENRWMIPLSDADPCELPAGVSVDLVDRQLVDTMRLWPPGGNVERRFDALWDANLHDGEVTRMIEALWHQVARELNNSDLAARVDSTPDFVVVAFPVDPGPQDVRVGLERSLPAERLEDSRRRGWVPESRPYEQWPE